MEEQPTMEILQVCKITPSSSSSPAAEFSLPLTFFDLLFFTRPPIEQIFFYSLAADEYSDQLDSRILQNLKHSLSLTLSHFLPLAGNLVWPDPSPEPFIRYKHGDSVSLTIAKTDADFDHLSSNHVRQANQSHFLVPDLPTSDNNVAPAMSLQITLFPNNGLSIGILTNHVVADGKTSTMFLKSWASICNSTLQNTLPPELTQVFDRTAINNFNGLQSIYDKYFRAILSNSKTFRLPPKTTFPDAVVSATFELTRADIENLRRKVDESQDSISTTTCSSPSLTRGRRLSTFVLTFAYVSICFVKAHRIEPKTSKICLSFPVDWRHRVGTLGGLNYFGNGVSGYGLFLKASEFEEENAMGAISNKICDEISEIEKNAKADEFVGMWEQILVRWGKEVPIAQVVAVGGSPRFGVYGIDFGWGSSKKVETVSINPSECFSMAESRNENGSGIELGIALPTQAMDIFCSLFYEGLKNLA